MTAAAQIAQLQARVAELEARGAALDDDNTALQNELVRRGMKLSCSRAALARATLAFERASQELHRAQAQLVHRQKTASVGCLAAGVAHELNTPVGAVVSAQDTLCRGVDRLGALLRAQGVTEREPRVGALLQTLSGTARVVEQGAQRIGATVERLGAFALLDSADVRPLDLRRGLADTLAMVSGELGEDVTVVRDFGDVPAVEAEPRALNQVFLNLLHNAITAIRATGAPGAITVETGVEDRRARVRIRDTGTGMDAAQVASLFEPKLTQQGARVAAGMGLPICACVIAQHGGEIAVDSSPGAGTTVTVLLPTMSIGA